MPKYGTIYMIEFPNKKIYIGQTTRSLDERVKDHIRGAFYTRNKHASSKIYRAIRKYTTKNNAIGILKVSVLEDKVDLNKINDKEIFYIKKYNSYNAGYNSTGGGEGILGYKHTRESKKLISKRSKKNKGMNATARKASQRQVNNIRNMYIHNKTILSIQKKYNNLAYNTIVDIVKNKTWTSDEYGKQLGALPKHFPKVTKKIANSIRRDYLNGDTIKNLSKKYCISTGYISNIINNKSHKDTRFSNKKIEKKKLSNIKSAAKLDENKVKEIRIKYKNYVSLSLLSKKYGVSVATIYNIVNNKTWSEI